MKDRHVGNGAQGKMSVFVLTSVRADCFWLLDQTLKYAVGGGDIPEFMSATSPLTSPAFLPERMDGMSQQPLYYYVTGLVKTIMAYFNVGSRLNHFSKVLDPIDPAQFRPLPSCPQYVWAKPRPINATR